MTKQHIREIPAPLSVEDLADWCEALDIPFSTADAVIGKAPGSFKKYLEGVNKMKHPDFVALQEYLRTRAEVLRQDHRKAPLPIAPPPTIRKGI